MGQKMEIRNIPIGYGNVDQAIAENTNWQVALSRHHVDEVAREMMENGYPIQSVAEAYVAAASAGRMLLGWLDQQGAFNNVLDALLFGFTYKHAHFMGTCFLETNGSELLHTAYGEACCADQDVLLAFGSPKSDVASGEIHWILARKLQDMHDYPYESHHLPLVVGAGFIKKIIEYVQGEGGNPRSPIDISWRLDKQMIYPSHKGIRLSCGQVNLLE